MKSKMNIVLPIRHVCNIMAKRTFRLLLTKCYKNPNNDAAHKCVERLCHACLRKCVVRAAEAFLLRQISIVRFLSVTLMLLIGVRFFSFSLI